MTELLLSRHGLPTSGELHPGLSAAGRHQAHRLGGWLRHEQIDLLVSSPMRRALETADIISARMSHPVDRVLDDLREWDTDLTLAPYVAIEDLAAEDPRAQAVAEGRYDDFVPELDVDAFRARAAAVLDELLTTAPGARVAAVCHGGILNAMIGGILGVPALFWVNPGYTSVSRVLRMPGGRTVVASVNDTAHLRGTPESGQVQRSA